MGAKEKRIVSNKTLAIAEDISGTMDMQYILSQYGDKINKFICTNTKEYISLISPDGKFIYINPSFYKLGYRPKDLINKNLIDYIHPDDAGSVYTLLADSNAMNNNREYDPVLHYRVVAKSGDWRELESSVNILQDQSGAFAILLISHEIIGRKESFNELKEWTDTFDTFVAKFDINGFMLFCNVSLLKLGGVTEADVHEKYFPDTRLFSHSDIERAKIIKCLNNSKAFLPSRIECTFLGAGNKPVPAIFNCQPVMDAEGNIKYITGEGKTITEEVLLRDKLIDSNTNLEERVRERTAEITEINKKLKEDIKKRKTAEEENIRLAAFPRESPHPILSSDPEGNIIYKNPAAANILEGLGLDSAKSLLPENHKELIRSCLNDRKSYNNIETRVKSHVFSWTYNPVPDINVIHLHGLDITDQKYFQEKLLHDTLHDKLTGLPNRSFFYDELQRSIKISQRRKDYHFAVLFMDLGRFKLINDSLGHLIGDKVLVEVAGRLSSCLRPEDTAARFGGDEFTIILNNIADSGDPVRVSERIQKKLSLPLTIEGHEIFPTASIGIAMGTEDYSQPEDILRDANTAMYHAKAEGISRYVIFDKTMHKQAVQLLELESNLKYAFERKEFCIHYQPIISLDSGKIAGFEALLRWQHPKRGLILPEEFVPMIEETGQIVPIGEWVIRKACSQLRTWHKKYPEKQHLFISVNLSSKQFTQPDLTEKISKILQDENLYPGYLTLEITESIIMDNIKKTNAVLSELQKLDVQIGIDDFGIGYSSLSNLHCFPIQTLKIDRSFIAVMNGKDWGSAVPHTIVNLGKHLEMDVIAEGVETLEQLAHLKNLDCGYAQGQYFSTPVDSREAESLIMNEFR